MKKNIIKIFSIGIVIGTILGCKTPSIKDNNQLGHIHFAKTITINDLQKHLYTIAADSMMGRDTGSEGLKKAGEYIIGQYKKLGITPPPSADNYYQPIASKYMRTAWSKKLPDSENIWAYIEGTNLKDEVVVLTAHYDHIGYKNHEIYNGADDNASGTSALLEIAEALTLAAQQGIKPKRSILLLHLTGEEYGLHGSRYYVNNPIIPLDKTIANVNVDMIGRNGFGMENNNHYVYVIGSDKLSSDLHKLSEKANFLDLKLDYRYNSETDPNQYYYRSDHYNFVLQKIPSIFYFGGEHKDYHQTTDTAEKINYPLLTKRTQLIFSLVWLLANTDEKPKIDK
ncbi:MAG: M28 family peptidase [Bacteroidota bacterium]|nr:M28 family peptidase [Bacteroidota bacterium]